MKSAINSANSSLWNTIKQTLYALQVLAIVSSIPMLSYIEVAHVDTKDQQSTENNASRIVNVKSGTVAYNQTNK